jgi:tetratricopeptide (TPR) repeat protein
MRFRTILLSTIFVFVGMAGCTRLYNNTEFSADHISPLVKKIQPAVVTVVAYDVNRKISNLGSGFFINNNGYLITNYHVLKGSYAADVKTYDGKAYPIELVVAESIPSDLVKVWVKIPESSIHSIPVTGTEPSIAARVVLVGSPLGLEQTVSEGIISAIRELPVVGKVFQLSAPISPGSSGSPVVNMRGNVVGVASFQATKGQNLNFAVSSKGILDLRPAERPKTLSEWTYDYKIKTPKLVEKLCKEGFSFSIRGEFKDALNYFKEATEKSPNDMVAWYGLGSCYDGLERPEQAIEAFKQVIRIDPKNATSYFNLARYYRKLGRYEKAIEIYYQAIEADPNHAPSYFELGMVYGKLKEFKKGEKAFKQVLRINPDHAPTYFYMGLTYNKLGRYDSAVTFYKKALKINPNSAITFYNLGIAYSGLGDSESEVEALKQAIRVDPDFAPAHYNMGLIYLNNSDKAASLGEYKILQQLDPDMAEMLFKKMY